MARSVIPVDVVLTCTPSLVFQHCVCLLHCTSHFVCALKQGQVCKLHVAVGPQVEPQHGDGTVAPLRVRRGVVPLAAAGLELAAAEVGAAVFVSSSMSILSCWEGTLDIGAVSSRCSCEDCEISVSPASCCWVSGTDGTVSCCATSSMASAALWVRKGKFSRGEAVSISSEWRYCMQLK
jgi:hypothetical protein